MTLRGSFLRSISTRLLARNDRFKGRHKGETCYIIGNGASLKSMDLEAFSDHPSIALNFLCLHNDYQRLDVRYQLLMASWYFYPWVQNSYTRKYQLNVGAKLFRKAFSKHSTEVTLFTNISNVVALGLGNTFYLYHFGHRRPDHTVCDISGAFSFMTGALYTAIALAINMGFKQAILVGCDYVFTPIAENHFYTFGPSARYDRCENVYEELFRETNGLIDLNLITDVGGSRWLPFQTYKAYTGRELRYRENTDIIGMDYLKMMQRAFEVGQYRSSILENQNQR